MQAYAAVVDQYNKIKNRTGNSKSTAIVPSPQSSSRTDPSRSDGESIDKALSRAFKRNKIGAKAKKAAQRAVRKLRKADVRLQKQAAKLGKKAYSLLKSIDTQRLVRRALVAHVWL